MEEKSAQAQRPVMLNDGTRLVRIELSDVAYIEADGRHSIINMANCNTSYALTLSLSALLAQLPEHQFVRIHRSFVVNVYQIKYIVSKSVIFSDGDAIAISDTYRDELLTHISVLN